MKNKAKRLIALFLTVVMACSMMVAPSHAAGEVGKLKVTGGTWDTTAKTCSIQVVAQNSEAYNLVSGDYVLSFDKDTMKLESVTGGTFGSPLLTMTPAGTNAISTANSNGYIKSVFSAGTTNVSIPGGQVYATYNFTMVEGAEAKEVEVQVSEIKFNYQNDDMVDQSYGDAVVADIPLKTNIPGAAQELKYFALNPASVTVNGTAPVTVKPTVKAGKNETEIEDLSALEWSVKLNDQYNNDPNTKAGEMTIGEDGTITVIPKAHRAQYVVTVTGDDVTYSGTKSTMILVTRAAAAAQSIAIYNASNEKVTGTDFLTIPVAEDGKNIYTYTAKTTDQYGDTTVVKPTWTLTTADSVVSKTDDAGTGSTTVTVNHSETEGSYKLKAEASGLSAEITLETKKIQVQWPSFTSSALTGTYGQTWSQIVTGIPTTATATLNGQTINGTFALGSSTERPEVGAKKYTLTFTGGGYTVSQQFDATISPRNISNATIAAISEQPYDGSEKKPTPAVTDSALSKTLVAGTDFDYDYDANTNAGTAKVTITGKGNYTGTKEATFTIKPASITLKAPVAVDAINANTSDNNDLTALTAYVQGKNRTIQSTDGTVTFTATWSTKDEFVRTGKTYTFTAALSNPTRTLDATGNYDLDTTAPSVTVVVKPVTANQTIAAANASITLSKAVIEGLADEADMKTALKLPASVSVGYTPEGAATTPNSFAISSWDKDVAALKTEAAKVKGNNDVVTVKLTPVYAAENAGGAPAWATLAAKPQFTLTIINKNPIPNEDITFADQTITYGGTYTPGASVASKTEYADAKFTYTYAKEDGTALSAEPTAAGTYVVTVTAQNDNYKGTKTAKLVIEPKHLTDAMISGVPTDFPYDGQEHKPALTVKDGETVLTLNTDYTVKYSDDATNAGTVTVEIEGKGNYDTKITKTFVIQQLDRNLAVAKTSLLLYPDLLTDALGVTFDDLDHSAVVTYTLEGDTTVVNRTNDSFTATGNGTVNVKVDIAATRNYKAATQKTAAINAWANPAEGLTVKTTATAPATTTGDKVTYTISGSTITVSGIKAADNGITFDDPSGRTATYADGKLTITAGSGDSAVTLAEYTVDVSGVTAIPTINVGEGTTTLDVDAGDTAGTVADTITDAATLGITNDLVSAQENTLDGAEKAAASSLANEAAAVAQTEENKTRITTAIDSDVTIEVKVGMKIEATGATNTTDEKSYTVDVKPVYTIIATGTKDSQDAEVVLVGTKEDDGTVTPDVLDTRKLSGAPITVSVKLPAYLTSALASGALFVDHIKSSGGTDYIKATLNGDKTVASWQVAEFSTFKLSVQGETKTVTFTKGDGTMFTDTFDYTKKGQTLPSDSKSGSTFDGWTIGGTEYTSVTDAFLKAIATTNPTATAKFTANTPGTTDPVTPSRPGTGGSSSGGSSSSDRDDSVTIRSSSRDHGTVRLSTGDARTGDTVTVTVRPDRGYEVDQVLVYRSNGSLVDVRSIGGDEYTFVMPSGTVRVEVTYKRTGTQTADAFTDVPNTYWAADAIKWVSENGYMMGNSSVTFNPEGRITRQQMWMIMARMAGASPYDFNDAKAWAIANGISDGTRPGNSVTRQQMVTILYRYAQMMDFTTSGGAGLDAFPDSNAVSDYAQEALQWSVGNNIVGGTADGRLNPNGTATRAQFATILQRFYTNAAR